MNLKEHYLKVVVPALMQKFGYANILAVPRVLKIVLNIGVSATMKDQKILETMKDTLRLISGQQPVERKAKKSISNFKVRKGQTVGLMVTLRGARMQDFLQKLINLTLPRMRDFRGMSTAAIDSQGNFTIGFREAVAFPEIKAGDLERQHGLEVTIVTSARNRKEGMELLKLIGLPFKNS